MTHKLVKEVMGGAKKIVDGKKGDKIKSLKLKLKFKE